MCKIQKKRYAKSKAVQDLEELALQDLKNRFPSNPYPPKKKYKDNSTNGLTRCVLDFLNISGCQAERINSTGRRIDNTKTIQDCIGRSRQVGSVKWIKGAGRTGTADVHSVIKGRAVKIEVKCKATSDNYQSEEQKAYQKDIEAAGGVYVIARTFEQFHGWYQEFINQNPK